jgi:hypothetical protein
VLFRSLCGLPGELRSERIVLRRERTHAALESRLFCSRRAREMRNEFVVTTWII